MLIEDLNLSLRTYNCLKRKGIDTVEQMMGMTDEELLCIRGFGAACLREVRTKTKRNREGVEKSPGLQEACFRNGEKHMKEKVIAMLMDHKTKPSGFCHGHIVQLIKQVESL